MLIIIRNSLIIAVCLYLAGVFLPEIMNVNETVAKYLFVIPVGIWGIKSKNKWWINLISFLLALIILIFSLDLLPESML
ncbi:hypothetical protein [Priestia megaterium]|uniref:Uncharacterized protein n=1 Tax=Priestia megaterium TaxID=1404 RepID=A0ABD4WWR6_PRIMG|nr:hypothetical protein [Priestia megaterium]MDD9784675.1 hypothetical protein [Priestia megaterium]MED4287553.1 hypothetical protein [Priestia megaterium]MED4297864.1 hypothetical protein [Priestia megaterium]USL45372.1 hypothetical protein LIS78_27910 [Priestia megaterium]